jgi:carbon monoxide dehydrogenase subunit G
VTIAPLTNVSRTGGGRTRVRHLLAWTAVILHGAFAGIAPAIAQAEPRVAVHETGGVYRVVATFSVSQPATAVMRVLSDYDQIPRFMPDVRSSTVLEQTDNHTVVEQEAVAKFLMFSKRIHLVLEVDETPGSLRFHDRCGASFSRYEGGWTLTEVDGRTLIAYELTANPSFDVPEFLLTRLLKRDSTRMIQRLQAEIAARQ